MLFHYMEWIVLRDHYLFIYIYNCVSLTKNVDINKYICHENIKIFQKFKQEFTGQAFINRTLNNKSINQS